MTTMITKAVRTIGNEFIVQLLQHLIARLGSDVRSKNLQSSVTAVDPLEIWHVGTNSLISGRTLASSVDYLFTGLRLC